MANETLRALGRVVAEGAKTVGTRALAHGMKSIVKDTERFTRKARKKLGEVVDKLEELTVVEDVEQDDDLRNDR